MRITIQCLAVVAGLLFALPDGLSASPDQPSFGRMAATYRPDPWHTDPCGARRPIAGICRMLRPVRG